MVDEYGTNPLFKKGVIMLGLIVSAGATAAELILGTVATVTTGKIAYDGLKNDKSESFHAAKIDEIHEKKNKEPPRQQGR